MSEYTPEMLEAERREAAEAIGAENRSAAEPRPAPPAEFERAPARRGVEACEPDYLEMDGPMEPIGGDAA